MSPENTTLYTKFSMSPFLAPLVHSVRELSISVCSCNIIIDGTLTFTMGVNKFSNAPVVFLASSVAPHVFYESFHARN